MKGDLHVHSTASDGTFTPTQLVSAALAAKLDVIAIADHDTVDGQAEAAEAASSTSLTVIPAVELSCLVGDADVHILGFHIDPEDPALRARLDELKLARLRRAETLIRTLTDAGYDVTLDDVLRHAEGGSVGRSHIARALVSTGHAADTREAFDRFIGRDRPFYIAKEAQSASEAILLIHAAGGVAVVAHPGIGDVGRHLDEMRAAGIDGVEAHHADHDPSQRETFAQYAADHGLLVTGGTDFHGPSAPNPALGDIDVPEEAVETLVNWKPKHQ